MVLWSPKWYIKEKMVTLTRACSIESESLHHIVCAMHDKQKFESCVSSNIKMHTS